MTHTEIGRRRLQALFDLLGMYQAATTNQLAELFWGGDQRRARRYLLRFLQEKPPKLHRLPHPLHRNGPYVYTLTHRSSVHSQKVVHHLALMDFHLAVVRHLAHQGARTVPELPWGAGLVPDQTIFWRDTVWAVEHHMSGQFSHTDDYRRFMEEEAYRLCHWWRPALRVGLAVLVSGSGSLEHVRGHLKRHNPPGLTWRVATRETALSSPEALLR